MTTKITRKITLSEYGTEGYVQSRDMPLLISKTVFAEIIAKMGQVEKSENLSYLHLTAHVWIGVGKNEGSGPQIELRAEQEV